MIVSDNVSVRRRLFHGLDAVYPRVEFLGSIKVVITFAHVLIFRKPALVVASVQSYVADRGGGDGARLYRPLEQRLIDVTQSNSELVEKVQNARLRPTAMTNFQHQRKILEPRT